MDSFYEQFNKEVCLPSEPELALADVVPGSILYEPVQWSRTKWLWWIVRRVDVQIYRTNIEVFYPGPRKYRWLTYNASEHHFYAGVALTTEQLASIVRIELRKAYGDHCDQEGYLLPMDDHAREAEMKAVGTFTNTFSQWLASTEGQTAQAQLMKHYGVEELLNG